MTGDVTPIKDALDNPQPAPVMAQEGDAQPEKGRQKRLPIDWKQCPITPLGIRSTEDGKQTCYYLDRNKQLVGLEANNKHGKNGMVALFGDEEWLEEHFPKWSKPAKGKPSEIIGWDQAEATAALIGECVRRGRFSSADRKRGRGAHRFDNGGLALHCGDKILRSVHAPEGAIKRWHWEDCGVLGDHVYAGDDPIPRPWEEAVGPEAAALLISGEIGRDGRRGLFRTWNWRRPLLDPRLLLGWVGGALIGGALPWRPNLWLTGGRGTGKSEINGQDKVLHRLLGNGCFRTANASAAAIRQSLMQATVPVLIDELEAKADNRQVTDTIELMRLSSSGDSGHRGGSDHNAHSFTLRSAFFASSINIPAMPAQDKSRLAICEVLPFTDDWDKAPDLDAYNLPVLGRKLLRRMVDGWPRLAATKAKYHDALKQAGHDGRACDQFGTLLACADVLIHDHDTADGLPDWEDVLEWADKCRPERLREIAQERPQHADCLDHLMGGQVQARGGEERVALASWVGEALDGACWPLLDDNQVRGDRAATRLAEMGLKLVNCKFYDEELDDEGRVKKGKGKRWGTQAFDPSLPGFLAIAPGQAAIAKLFEGSNQGWAEIYDSVLERFPMAVRAQKVAFGRRKLSAVCVPLCWVFPADEGDEKGLPEASSEKALKQWLADECEGAEV